MYDFTFLAPCPSSGIIIQGTCDEVVTHSAVQKLVDKLKTQRHITIDHVEIPGGKHFFENEMDQRMGAVDGYSDKRDRKSKRLNSIHLCATIWPSVDGKKKNKRHN